MAVMPKDPELSTGQFVTKFLMRVFLCVVAFGVFFVFITVGLITDGYNFCVDDESASDSWGYWVLQQTVFDRCVMPEEIQNVQKGAEDVSPE